MKRKSPYSQLYKLTTIMEGVTVLLPVTEDIPDEYLQWHYEFGLDREDYEYAQAVWRLSVVGSGSRPTSLKPPNMDNRSLARNPIMCAARDQFVRKHLQLIAELPVDAWPRMSTSPHYAAWLQLVDTARAAGLWSYRTSVGDTILNIKRKANRLQNRRR